MCVCSKQQGYEDDKRVSLLFWLLSFAHLTNPASFSWRTTSHSFHRSQGDKANEEEKEEQSVIRGDQNVSIDAKANLCCQECLFWLRPSIPIRMRLRCTLTSQKRAFVTVISHYLTSLELFPSFCSSSHHPLNAFPLSLDPIFFSLFS